MSEAEGAVATAQPETTSESWYPTEYKELVDAKGWKEPGNFLKSYKELESHLGKVKSQPNIPDELNDELKSQIFTKLGKPETPDKYSLTAPEGVQVNEEVLGKFRTFAHGLNLTDTQAQELLKFEIEVSNEVLAAQEQAALQAIEETVKTLKNEWKENYDGNFKKAKETAEKLEILDELEALGLADNPNIIKMLHKVNSKLSEDALKSVKTVTQTNDERLKEIMGSEAFKNRMHPDHAAMHAEFLKLHGVG